MRNYLYAQSETRTRTMLPSGDFESNESTIWNKHLARRHGDSGGIRPRPFLPVPARSNTKRNTCIVAGEFIHSLLRSILTAGGSYEWTDAADRLTVDQRVRASRWLS